MKRLSTILALAMSCVLAVAFDFKLTWDWPSGYVPFDSFTESVTQFANLKGFNVYRGETPTSFVLVQTVGLTNVVQLRNQPTVDAYYCVTAIEIDGSESAPSNTNHVIPAKRLGPVTGLIGSR